MSTQTTTIIICDAGDGEITPKQIADPSTVLRLQDGGFPLDFHSPGCLQIYGQNRLDTQAQATADAVASVTKLAGSIGS